LKLKTSNLDFLLEPLLMSNSCHTQRAHAHTHTHTVGLRGEERERETSLLFNGLFLESYSSLREV